ncbi:TPA: winged helix-turn-helix domain-containing protein [Citrobacter koseri]|uniref:winged helix-turn-helix domain-containing protein n=1 Tax=Citrobacter koseri TaxID=545 RepID=UPI00388F89A5|nr:winged helix-turn-helix domain-containing protein [Citrobacter koseri]
MRIIINDEFCFDPENKTLEFINKESAKTVTLTNQGSRLLLDLVQHSRQILKRDELLRRVWEEEGYTPSNNNLYIAISELRKSFSAFDPEYKVIETIPKVGFMLNANVIIENPPPPVITGSLGCYKGIVKRTWGVTSGIILIVFFIFAGFFLLTYHSKFSIEKEKLPLVGVFRNCDIYALDNISNKKLESIIEILNKGVIQAELCEKSKSTIFYQYSLIDTENILITLCEKTISGKNECTSMRLKNE